MNSLSPVFSAMPLSSGIFLDARFTAPWCISARVGPEDCGRFVPEPGAIVAFHYIYQGQTQLTVKDEPSVTINTGEVVILPRNDSHLLGSDCALAPVVADELIQLGPTDQLATINHGGGGKETRMICGFLGCEGQYIPVLDLLPKVIKLTLPDPVSASWFDSSFKLAAREKMFHPHSATQTLAKLTELLFLDALQHYIQSAPAETFSWFDGLSDPRIMNALSKIQRKPDHRWTTEELAGAVGMSRSAFAARFTELMGLPPMRYLTLARLRLASRRLRHSQDPLIKIALESGYESEAAFNRAFKKEYGLPPARWRGSRAAIP